MTNLVPKRHLLLIVPFESIKYRKKEMCLDNKVQKTIGDVYCPSCKNEKCVYLSTKKTSFYDCEKCKACCHVLNFHFRNQKLTIMLFGGDGLHCFAFTHYHFKLFQSTLKQHDILSLLRRY